METEARDNDNNITEAPSMLLLYVVMIIYECMINSSIFSTLWKLMGYTAKQFAIYTHEIIYDIVMQIRYNHNHQYRLNDVLYIADDSVKKIASHSLKNYRNNELLEMVKEISQILIRNQIKINILEITQMALTAENTENYHKLNSRIIELQETNTNLITQLCAGVEIVCNKCWVKL